MAGDKSKSILNRERLLVGLVMLVAAILMAEAHMPASWVFTSEIHVEDIDEPGVPEVTYTHNLRSTQTASHVFEVHQVSPDRVMSNCVSEGISLYSTQRSSTVTRKLDQFIGDDLCFLGAGEYYIEACWALRVVLSSKVYCTRSNRFTVGEIP